MVNKPLGNSYLNKQSNRGRSNGYSCGSGRGKGGTSYSALLGNQSSAKDALNKCGWRKLGYLGGKEDC